MPIAGVAVARRAARELELGAGIPSTSVAGLLDRFDRGRSLPRGVVLVVDEAGMLGTRDLARLLDHVQQREGKLVLVGDPHQLPEIDAGGAFAGLVRRGMVIELRENRRQVEPWERTAVDHLRSGHVDQALALYNAHDRIHIAADDTAAIDRVVSEWWNSRSDDVVMIAGRRNDVARLNAAARERMRAAGRLGAHELRVAGAGYAPAIASSSAATTPGSTSATATAPSSRPLTSHAVVPPSQLATATSTSTCGSCAATPTHGRSSTATRSPATSPRE